MTKPRVYLFSLGGTIATEPGKQGMKVGLSADDLLRAVPDLEAIADIHAEAVSRTRSSDLALDDLYALAARIQAMADEGETDAVVITQGTDTLEETAFLLDLVLRVDIPVVMTAAMRNPKLSSPEEARPPQSISITRL